MFGISRTRCNCVMVHETNSEEKAMPNFQGTSFEVDQAINNVQKAISSTNVSGLLLVREDLQSELAIAAPVDTPIRNRLSRIEGNGSAHSWYKLVGTSATEGTFLGTSPSNGFFARGGLPTATQASYRYMSAPYVSLGDLVQVNFFDQMAGRSYTDIKKLQTKMKMINVALMEEWSIINGDSTTGAGLQFDGLNQLITTNSTDLGGAALTLSALTTTMRTVVSLGGKPQAIIFSLYENQKMSDLILGSYYRLTQTGAGALADIPAGVAVTRWVSPMGTLDLIASRFITETYSQRTAYIIDDKSVTDDGNAIAMVDMMPISSIDLALTTTAYKTLIAEFTVLMMTIEIFQAKIINIGN